MTLTEEEYDILAGAANILLADELHTRQVQSEVSSDLPLINAKINVYNKMTTAFAEAETVR